MWTHVCQQTALKFIHFLCTATDQLRLGTEANANTWFRSGNIYVNSDLFTIFSQVYNQFGTKKWLY